MSLTALSMYNEAGRDNIITEMQTIINDRSVWFLMLLVSALSILWLWIEWIERKLTKRLKYFEEILKPRMMEDASYKNQTKRPCAAGTRDDILEEIQSWIKDVSKESQCFYWLYGEPGVGKSAIATSIVQYCMNHNSNILCAQFFVSRVYTKTTNPAVLFPTICWQLCGFSQKAAAAIEKTLRDQPTLVHDISYNQATKLFVEAIKATAAEYQSQSIVIVIDALDEMDTKRLGYLAQILTEVVTTSNLPRNAKLFVTSRTDDLITKSFNLLRHLKQVKFKYLVAEDSVDEVSRYMEKKIEEILLEYSMNLEDFKDDCRRISSQASGLYIWGMAVLKLLRTEIRSKGTTCFKGFSDMVKTEGGNDINTLYLNFLQSICDGKDGDWERQRFRRIIGAILVRQTPLSIFDIEQLLDLKDPFNFEPVDVVHFVRRYRTILVEDTKEIDGFVKPRVRKYFAEFITSKWAKEFRVDVSASHGEIALRCMNQFHSLTTHLTHQEPQPFPSQLVYASRFWQLHFTRMAETNLNGVEKTNDYALDIFENEANSLLAIGMKGLKTEVTANLKITEITTKKETPFKSHFVFSPDGTQFASLRGDDIEITSAKTGFHTVSLVGHERNVQSIEFAPDGAQLVSGSQDTTARIWDTEEGAELHVLRGHTGTVHYAAFSHDGKAVVTGSWDETLRTWDSSTGQLLNVFNGHNNPVLYCTFSPNNQRIASLAFQDDNIMVWDVETGESVFKLSHSQCDMISFCPGSFSDRLISRDYFSIKLWHTESGKKCANYTTTSPAFVNDYDWEQGSASKYISVPPTIGCTDNSDVVPHVYTLKTKYGAVRGIVEHGQPEGVWEVYPGSAGTGTTTTTPLRVYSAGSTTLELGRRT